MRLASTSTPPWSPRPDKRWHKQRQQQRWRRPWRQRWAPTQVRWLLSRVAPQHSNMTLLLLLLPVRASLLPSPAAGLRQRRRCCCCRSACRCFLLLLLACAPPLLLLLLPARLACTISSTSTCLSSDSRVSLPTLRCRRRQQHGRRRPTRRRRVWAGRRPAGAAGQAAQVVRRACLPPDLPACCCACLLPPSPLYHLPAVLCPPCSLPCLSPRLHCSPPAQRCCPASQSVFEDTPSSLLLHSVMCCSAGGFVGNAFVQPTTFSCASRPADERGGGRGGHRRLLHLLRLAQLAVRSRCPIATADV